MAVENGLGRPSKQIVICGYNSDSLGILARTLLRCSESPIEVAKAALKDVPSPEEGTVISCRPDDIFAIKPALACEEPPAPEDFRIILIVRDPRDLVIGQLPAAANEYAYGYDRTLEVTSTGLVTYCAPGILTMERLVTSVLKQFGDQTLLVRHEDLLQNPDLVQFAIAAHTGLKFNRAFSRQLQRDANWEKNAQSFVFRTSPLANEDLARIVRQFRLAPELFDLLTKYHFVASAEDPWFERIKASVPDACDDTPGTIVGFYTNDKLYRQEAKRLRHSVEKLGLPLQLESIKKSRDWLTAVRRKPEILLEMRNKLRGPLLYVDVDAVVHKDPWPYLRGYKGDVAVSGHRREAVISGTFLLNDTPGAKKFLEDWIETQENNPEHWDQHSLEQLIVENHNSRDRYWIQYLPIELCKVFDRNYNPPVEGIIEHLQASRAQSSRKDDSTGLKNFASRMARVAELEKFFNFKTE